jgi:hypothetical protein
MDKLEIEFKESSTGSYSPWHLDIIDKYNIPVLCTADICGFVKIGEEIYRIYDLSQYYRLYDYVCNLEKQNDNGEITDDEVLKEIDDIVNNRKENFNLKKCTPLKEFEESIK